MTSVLGIDVPADLLRQWCDWFAPDEQPFPVGSVDELKPMGRRDVEPTPEVRDTFCMYAGAWTWMGQQEFADLPSGIRRALLRGREATGRLGRLSAGARTVAAAQATDSRVVWWPDLLRRIGNGPVIDYVEEGLPPSRHGDVPAAVWSAAGAVLPAAEGLAGRFPAGSGPNCFGTVMAAAGVPGAAAVWMLQTPFEDWLAAAATPTAGRDHDHRPGTVLVWRGTDHRPVHAAVTLGGGYVLSKPSQSWYSPRVVWTVADTIKAARANGQRLHRYLLHDGPIGRRVRTHDDQHEDDHRSSPH